MNEEWWYPALGNHIKRTTTLETSTAIYNFKMASTMNIPSICIPRVHYKMNGDDVAQVFNELFAQDCVDHVDMVQREDRNTGYSFFVSYVHFKPITDIDAFQEGGGEIFLKKIEAEQEVKLIYRDPWFWKVRKNTKTKHVRKGPRILAGEDEAEFMKQQKEIIQRRYKRKQGGAEEGEITE